MTSQILQSLVQRSLCPATASSLAFRMSHLSPFERQDSHFHLRRCYIHCLVQMILPQCRNSPIHTRWSSFHIRCLTSGIASLASVSGNCVCCWSGSNQESLFIVSPVVILIRRCFILGSFSGMKFQDCG